MSNNQQTSCPACGKVFECRAGDISACQCAAVQLNDAERAFIASRFSRCLCAACMLDMKQQHHNSLSDRSTEER